MTKLPKGDEPFFMHFTPDDTETAHRFFIDGTHDKRTEITEWCERMAKGSFTVRSGIMGDPIYVRLWNDQDAVLFKLTWA